MQPQGGLTRASPERDLGNLVLGGGWTVIQEGRLWGMNSALALSSV